ncbi:YrdB family protein [Streptomyces sp. NPDC001380]|uniref:YrdB family protein n=1 Tax=Streptomyces sp. NPDC001380 TaxID=3364566 RepID=UPI0036BDCB43
MRGAVKGANLALRFLLELVAFAALAYGGYHAPAPLPLRIALAVLLPAAAAWLWGRYASPRAVVRSAPAWLATQLAVMGAAAAALTATGHPAAAAGFAVLVVANTAMLAAVGSWHPPRPGGAPRPGGGPGPGGRADRREGGQPASAP